MGRMGALVPAVHGDMALSAEHDDFGSSAVTLALH